MSRDCHILGPRKADFEDLARRSEVGREDYWLQHDPDGDVLVVASDSDQAKFQEIMANPQTDFDRWLREEIQNLFGFDPGGPSTTITGNAPG